MSRSYRTRPKKIIAQERMLRNSHGRIIFPRIIIREPKQGDIHPLNRKMVAMAYHKLPIEYFYGLKEIELKARTGSIGRPFGKYSCRSKKIVLYSVPGRQWKIEKPAKDLITDLRRYHAEVKKVQGRIIVEWKESFLLTMFYLSILFHELGHHYMHQYKCKRKPPMDVYLNEWHADAQVIKLQKYAFKTRID